MASTRSPRLRWIALGAALCALGGGGTFVVVHAADTGSRSVFVPITPCRLIDTRPGTDNVGPRNTPLGANDTLLVTVRGTNGNCAIASDATAIVMNTTAVSPTSASYITLFPADAARPLASNLNVIAGQAPVPNLVTVPLSSAGQISIFNLAGSVDIVGDVTGYYAPEAGGVAGPPGPAGTGTANRGQLLTTIDSAGQVGTHTSIRIGVDGLPVITYTDVTNGALKIVHCSDTACTTFATPVTLDPSPANATALAYTDVAIGSDGFPIAAFLDGTAIDLKVVHCTAVDCSTADSPLTLDSAGNVGYDVSVEIGSDGFPIVQYADLTLNEVRIVHCTTVNCSAHDASHILASVAPSTSEMTIGADGFPIVAYHLALTQDLLIVHCTNTACSTNDAPRTLDSTGTVGQEPAIAIGVDGFPIVSEYDSGAGDLKVVHCTTVSCSTNDTARSLDGTDFVGTDGAITIGADGRPIVSFRDNTANTLRVVRCGDIACATNDPARSVASAGYFTSITIGADGLPIISFYNFPSADLSVLHCSDIACIPYVRRN
jgi:hypothetical protein